MVSECVISDAQRVKKQTDNMVSQHTSSFKYSSFKSCFFLPF